VETIAQITLLSLKRYRPWYRQKCAPSQLDIVWTWCEALHTAGFFLYHGSLLILLKFLKTLNLLCL